jgi:hypothetical protein
MECGLWLYQNQEMTSNQLFELALNILRLLPRDEKGGDDAVEEAIQLAIPSLGTDNTARSLICESLLHPRYAWRYIIQFSFLDNEIGDIAREGEAMVIFNTQDWSRRNGIVYHIIQDENKERAVSRMLRILEDYLVLRWNGHQILDSLFNRGHGQDALTILHRIAADKNQSTTNRQEAEHLAKLYQREFSSDE